ncbi:PREDICTED: uncharacterized protein C10orf88 homolog [Crocodylus porosus]|uniref:Chromosome 10 open reading frame 88 n=1 Tax=Crocodylus porosus TaxID=8502 RepID=A0A7M4ESK7_CROPO|nr:PREDICTED: uncharacterized protein C10orf88 homolog [Crocodylus porosus]
MAAALSGDAAYSSNAPASPRLAAGCSWECGDLAGLVRLLPEDAAAGEALGQPEHSEDSVVLERRLPNDGSDAPCVLYLHCDPRSCEEIACVGVLSEARNMEVYVGEEYCGTSRGEHVCTVQGDSKSDGITLYKKYLKLECPTAACRIKLVSVGEKQTVLISKIVVKVREASSKPADFPSLGSSIDLNRVQMIMESMGSKLSPGAQQLMDMVKCQQKNSLSLGDKLQCILGNKKPVFGDIGTIGGLNNTSALRSLDESSNGPCPLNSYLPTETVSEDLKRQVDLNAQGPSRKNTSDLGELKRAQQSTLLPGRDCTIVGSSIIPNQASEVLNMPSSGLLLPFLQNLCGQVNHLRLEDGNKHFEKSTAAKEEGIQNVRLEQQPICSYLEKIISKNMDLMEKKLMDYIDLRIQNLQEHIDNKIVLLVDLVQNSKSNKASQEHYDSGEGFSNGER